MKKRLNVSETFAVGSMLFGLFFGAGNLIFPVFMGQSAGSQVWPAVIGFIITGVGVPLLGVVAMGMSRSESLLQMSSRVSHGYGMFFTCALYLTIGPFFAIPRCASTSFSVGIKPMLQNESTANWLIWIFAFLFFAAVLWFSLKPGKILTWVGKLLTPLFLLSLALLIVTVYNEETLFEKYGLTPPEMIELKALMGDASDRIPGVADVGEKTALDLITRFHSIDYIYSHLPELDIREAVRGKLLAGKESAYLSKTLGTICREVPVSRNLEDYRIAKRNDTKAAALLRSLEFYKLLEKLGLNSVPEVQAPAAAAAQSFTVVEGADFAPENGELAVLIEQPGQGEFAAGCAGKVCRLSEQQANRLLQSGAPLCVQDVKALYHRLGAAVAAANICFDLSLAGYLCAPSASSYGAERLYEQYVTGQPELKTGDELLLQAAHAVLLTERLQSEIEQNNMQSLLTEIEIPLALTLAEMERTGFLIDRDGIQKMSAELKVKIAALEQEIHALAGHDFNIKSPQQLGTVLFEELDLPFKKKTSRGYSTTAEILEKLRNSHPIIPLILDYRRLTKLESTYCVGLLKEVQPDGRIHTTFNQTETRTGRISSLEPNLQNIPVKSAEGRELRRYFCAGPGMVLIDADYSQIELRVLAHMADDKNMQQAFNEGVDIHTKTASEVFDLPPVLVTPQMRRSAKAVNFGIVYGIGAFSLAGDIGVSRAEAARYIESYFKTYPNVQKYMEQTVAQAHKDGYVTTLFHRRRYLPELKSSNKNLIAFGERVAKNMPIQGTAADIIKLAMVRVRNRLVKERLNARIILQVHDELIIESSEADAEQAGQILKTEMENAVKLKVALTVDMHRGKTWFEAKE